MWKDIENFEGYYQVSDNGEIRSVDRYIKDINGKARMLKGKMMKLTQSKGRNNDGYLVVNLRKNRTSTVLYVHKIVAMAFIDNQHNFPTVNHIDGNKYNNRVENLEWVTYKDNNIHALECNLRQPRGNKIIQIDKQGNIIAEYKSSYEAERITNISFNSISHCLNGRAYSAGGYVWKKVL